MCDCAQTADKKLADMNTAIDWAWLINPKTGKTAERLQIKTKKVNPRVRKGPAVLVASFCPFCGSALGKPENPP
jgi:hypothetical protein